MTAEATLPPVSSRLPTLSKLPRLTPFGEWLERHGISHHDASAALSVTRAHVWYLATGRACPKLGLAFKIRNWTRDLDAKDEVDLDSWEPWIIARNDARESR